MRLPITHDATHTTRPGALSRVERDLTLPTAISCATDAPIDMVGAPICPDLDIRRKRALEQEHRRKDYDRTG